MARDVVEQITLETVDVADVWRVRVAGRVADCVVLAMYRRPEVEVYGELRAMGVDLYLIGDASSSRLADAIVEAERTGRLL